MKRQKVAVNVSPLRLHLWIPIKDVRKMIWAYLDKEDKEIVLCAHNLLRTPVIDCGYGEKVIRDGNTSLLRWLLRYDLWHTESCIHLMTSLGNFEMIKMVCTTVLYLLPTGGYNIHHRVFIRSAIEYRHWNILEWFYTTYRKHSHKMRAYICSGIVVCHDVMLFVWARSRRMPGVCGREFWRVLVKERAYPVLEYLIENKMMPLSSERVTAYILELYVCSAQGRMVLHYAVNYYALLQWFVLGKGYPLHKEKALRMIPKTDELAVWIRTLV